MRYLSESWTRTLLRCVVSLLLSLQIAIFIFAAVCQIPYNIGQVAGLARNEAYSAQANCKECKELIEWHDGSTKGRLEMCLKSYNWPVSLRCWNASPGNQDKTGAAQCCLIKWWSEPLRTILFVILVDVHQVIEIVQEIAKSKMCMPFKLSFANHICRSWKFIRTLALQWMRWPEKMALATQQHSQWPQHDLFSTIIISYYCFCKLFALRTLPDCELQALMRLLSRVNNNPWPQCPYLG